MQAEIDPLTGGLVFKSEDEKQEERSHIKNLITPSVIPDYVLKSSLDPNPRYNPRKSRLSIEERVNLVLSVGEEVVRPEEVRKLLERKEYPICYDGFEPSGRMHIAQGIMKAINVNKLTDAGCIFVFWVADWFALLNNKMGGDLNKIRIVGQYFIEIWKAAGMKMENVKFLWCSDEINKNASEYWQRVMDIARKNNLTRIKKCSQIMGREDSNEMPVAQLLYPCMQCADIFFLKADICQLGMDQRKVNMLAREYCDDIKQQDKPIIVSHHMLMGMVEGEAKMSKSNPDSAIFMEDSEQDVKRKIKSAFCPPQVVEGNPLMDYTKYIIFPGLNELEVTRKPENGGDKTYKSQEALEEDYKSGALHPGDLKPALAKALNTLIQPVRDHFNNNPHAKKILELVRSFTVTK